jgi:Flp pilus assembly protein TadG
LRRSPLASLVGFARDRRGVSAVEFAFIAPLLILIYFSLAELCQAMLAERKVQHASSAIGDLVSQVGTITPSQLTDVYSAGSSILAPYSTTPLGIRVSSVTTDNTGVAHVDWSCGQNMADLAAGSTVTLPANLLGPSQSIVMSEVTYTYQSPLNYLFKSAITWTPTFYLRPRVSSQVTCPTCTGC